MSYLIAAVLLIFIIGLVILFRSSKKEKPQEAHEPAVTYPEETVEEHVVAPVLEAEEAEAEQEETAKEPVAEKPDKEAVEEETEQIAAPAEEEEFVELSFDVEEAEEGPEEEFVEISLVMEEDSTEPVVDIAPAVDEDEENIGIAPALDDSLEETEITVEDAPEELAEKLNYYFGGDEETPPPVEEAVEESEEPGTEEEAVESQETEDEIVLDEPILEPAMPEAEPAAEIMEPEVFARLTLDSYEAELHTLESRLRQELRDAIGDNETERRAALEYKLQAVCEKQASIEDNFHRQEELIETAGKVLDEVQNESLRRELPGFDIDEATKQLQLGNYEQVETVLGEASLQLEHESELVSRVYYQCGQLAEERLDYESAFEDYRNAYAAESEHEDYLLAAGYT